MLIYKINVKSKKLDGNFRNNNLFLNCNKGQPRPAQIMLRPARLITCLFDNGVPEYQNIICPYHISQLYECTKRDFTACKKDL